MARSSHTVTIVRDELSRSTEIQLDGVYIASTNYDESGWVGLELIEGMATTFAKMLNFKLEEVDPPYEEEEE